MNISDCFLPCAGLGTRMGPIGKRIPKPLWPLFDSSLLELQVLYAKSLGAKNFYINTHHLAETFKTSIKSLGLSELTERELLGSGGCFHHLLENYPNISSINIFNPDSFLLLDSGDWLRFQDLCNNFDHVLIGIPCHPEALYNRLVLDIENYLVEIIKPNQAAPAVTYSGFGKINLSSIPKSAGKSGFFESVLDPRKQNVKVFIPQNDFEFWDFGVLDSYKENIYKILENPSSRLSSFLKEAGKLYLFNPEKFSYSSNNKKVINFTGVEISQTEPGIYLNLKGFGKNEDTIVKI